jgi:hypothetical protein
MEMIWPSGACAGHQVRDRFHIPMKIAAWEESRGIYKRIDVSKARNPRLHGSLRNRHKQARPAGRFPRFLECPR